MRFRWTQLAAAVAAAAVMATAAHAQAVGTDEGKRKTKSKNSPGYPELARRMNVSGKVKIEVIITPDGRVRSTRVIGGHPLLVQACQDGLTWGDWPGRRECLKIQWLFCNRIHGYFSVAR